MSNATSRDCLAADRPAVPRRHARRPRGRSSSSNVTSPSGDDAAFETLVDLHGPMVLGLCRRMLRDPRDVEDASRQRF